MDSPPDPPSSEPAPEKTCTEQGEPAAKPHRRQRLDSSHVLQWARKQKALREDGPVAAPEPDQKDVQS